MYLKNQIVMETESANCPEFAQLIHCACSHGFQIASARRKVKRSRCADSINGYILFYPKSLPPLYRTASIIIRADSSGCRVDDGHHWGSSLCSQAVSVRVVAFPNTDPEGEESLTVIDPLAGVVTAIVALLLFGRKMA